MSGGRRFRAGAAAKGRCKPRAPPRGAQLARLRRRGALRQQQIRQTKEETLTVAVFGQAAVAHLGIAEVTLHVQKGMLDLCPGRGLAPLLLGGGAAGRQAPPPPRPQRHLPVDRPRPWCSGRRATPS